MRFRVDVMRGEGVVKRISSRVGDVDPACDVSEVRLAAYCIGHLSFNPSSHRR